MTRAEEEAQQRLARLGGHVQRAMEALMAAYTAATSVADNGGPDYRKRLNNMFPLVEGLHGDLQEMIGPVESHRGARTGPTCSGDPDCPVHGDGLCRF